MLESLKRFSLRRFGHEARRASAKDASADIAFLHIGKNAGTQIMSLAKQMEDVTGTTIKKYGHNTRLRDLHNSVPYFFSIRDPVTRFKSAFYSRKRKGQPRLYREWTENEAKAFADFEHSNDLAESLFSSGVYGAKAFMAIQSISHTTRHQVDWFAFEGYFLETRPPLWIIRQEHFRQDFEDFLVRAKINVRFDDLTIDTNSKIAHANDYRNVPELSDVAIRNLEQWYVRDKIFYKTCEEWMLASKA